MWAFLFGISVFTFSAKGAKALLAKGLANIGHWCFSCQWKQKALLFQNLYKWGEHFVRKESIWSSQCLTNLQRLGNACISGIFAALFNRDEKKVTEISVESKTPVSI